MHKTLRKIFGVLFFLQGIIWILIHIHEMNLFHWIYSFFFSGLGITYFYVAFGSDTTEICAENDFVKLRWVNWIRPKIIQYSEIEKLTFTMFDIEISRKGKKPLRLQLDFMEKDQKKEIREFFMKLAREKGLNHENRYRG